ncbi:CAP domain-containing protein [Psychrobacillus sp.]|uniref:CAP domain-containing protein n=1 Tax=Psychrobacillus sp. TaxID=1871623 RepID=UPI0028BD36DD|nr:CAP domain-containing protein [Psychrobacillus sp.]
MNKKHSLIVGLLAGGLLFSTNTAEASMSTGTSNTTSEVKTSITNNGKSLYKYNKVHSSNKRPVSNSTPNTAKPEAPKTEVVQVSSVIQEVVNLTNKERAKAGLKALQMDTKLTQSAQAKSQDMKNKNYFSHTSPTYGSPFDQMKSFGVTYKSAAENIAMGQRSATEVVNAWMKSPGHKANIMNPSYTHIGVGLSNSGYYWTQQFIGK